VEMGGIEPPSTVDYRFLLRAQLTKGSFSALASAVSSSASGPIHRYAVGRAVESLVVRIFLCLRLTPKPKISCFRGRDGLVSLVALGCEGEIVAVAVGIHWRSN
jgi:hypothetical protein